MRDLVINGLPNKFAAEDFFKPGITSVIQPTFDMGYRAVEVLLKRINKETADDMREMVRLPATLIVRDSSSTQYGASSPEAAANGRQVSRTK